MRPNAFPKHVQAPSAIKRPTVAVVDDHPVVIDGLMCALMDHYEFILTATSGEEFIARLYDLGDVDIAIVDLSMPGMSGFAVLEWLKEHHPHVRAVAFSFSTESAWVRRAMDAGACCYILKDAARADLLHALSEVRRNGYFHSDLVLQSLEDDNGTVQVLAIPPREMEFLRLVCTLKDQTYPQIGDLMGVSPHAVDGYFRYFSKRFKVRSRADLVVFAIENKLLPPAPPSP